MLAGFIIIRVIHSLYSFKLLFFFIFTNPSFPPNFSLFFVKMKMMMRRLLPRPFLPRLSRSKCTLSQTAQQNDPPLPRMPPFDFTPPPYTGPSADEILAKRREYLNPAIFHFFKKPVSFSSRLFIFFFFCFL